MTWKNGRQLSTLQKGNDSVNYEYDSESVHIGKNGNAITSAMHIGNLNPFHYRGYYLDSETGLYYLMSRYYDPVTHRFVNADGYFQSGGGILDANMSAYCGNNPINFYDPTGTKECPIHHEYWDPTCTICRPDYVKVLEKQKLKKSNGTSTISVALGSVKDSSYKGWTWRVDSPNTNTKTERHIHITNGIKSFAQNYEVFFT